MLGFGNPSQRRRPIALPSKTVNRPLKIRKRQAGPSAPPHQISPLTQLDKIVIQKKVIGQGNKEILEPEKVLLIQKGLDLGNGARIHGTLVTDNGPKQF
jgi:hypothetical protein